MIRKKKKKEEERYSTPYTLLDLDSDAADAAERLKEFTVGENSHTPIDKDYLKPPPLLVIGKEINHQQIYVKLKLKGDQTKRV